MVGPTSHPKIMRAARATIDPEWLEECLAELERLAESADTLGVVAKSRSMVKSRTASAPKPFWKTRCTDPVAGVAGTG